MANPYIQALDRSSSEAVLTYKTIDRIAATTKILNVKSSSA